MGRWGIETVSFVGFPGLVSNIINDPSSFCEVLNPAEGQPGGPEPTVSKARGPTASHGPAQWQLLLGIAFAFFIEPLHIPVGADEAAHHRLGLAPAAGGDFRLPGLLICGPLGIFGLPGLGWLHPLLNGGAEPEAGAEAEAAAAHDDGQAVGEGYLDDGTG